MGHPVHLQWDALYGDDGRTSIKFGISVHYDRKKRESAGSNTVEAAQKGPTSTRYQVNWQGSKQKLLLHELVDFLVHVLELAHLTAFAEANRHPKHDDGAVTVRRARIAL